MVDSEPGAPESLSEDAKRTLPDWAVGVLAVEAISLLIGLAMPITPSKTGSTWTPAQLFWTDPSYLAEVVVYFVLTNLLILAFLFGVWAFSKIKRSS